VIVPTRLVLAGVIAALVATGCATTPSSPSPSPNSTPSPAASGAASATPSAAPTSAPSPGPSSTPSPTVAPSVATCDALPQTGQLPSDRFTDLKVSTGADADRLTFVFGNPSLPGPVGPPQGSLEVAVPPFTQAASGAPIAVVGQHVVQVRFSGMSLANDVGQPTYAGTPELKPDLTALRHAVLFDASEGVIGWYVGYDGSGCLTLVRNGNDVTLIIGHG
jgi:hypothetical protein